MARVGFDDRVAPKPRASMKSKRENLTAPPQRSIKKFKIVWRQDDSSISGGNDISSHKGRRESMDQANGPRSLMKGQREKLPIASGKALK
jgi:hypothetical protein